MGLYDKLMGKATITTDTSIINNYLSNGESVLVSYKFFRDSIILTNLGIYMVDVQGLTGKKVEVKFFPAKAISNISFETAGTFDLDVDIKIGVTNNMVQIAQGFTNAPISFKVPSAQSKQAQEIVSLVKEYYLC